MNERTERGDIPGDLAETRDLPQQKKAGLKPRPSDSNPTRSVEPSDLAYTSPGDAPPCRPPLPGGSPPAPTAVSAPLALPSTGEQFDDFKLLRELGVGAFGRVYLARQVSLDRLVALKVSANRGHEGRTLARLEHAHIVRVFAEFVDPARDLRVLCMQFIPGTTLHRVIAELATLDPKQWSGRAILDVLDGVDTGLVALDPAALREREYLAGYDFVEAVCWLGARLAEALAHAHDLDVLHRDLKPANVLLNRYGRPFLADFNVSFAASRAGDEADQFGGTLGYMAPEHLDAFATGSGTSPEAVDERADLYSLGVVLFELCTGRLPFERRPRSGRQLEELVRELAAERHAGPPSLPAERGVPGPLARAICRCLEPDPKQRYQSAAELARALDGCRELHRVERSLPPPGPLTRGLRRWPFALGGLLALLPHVLGSVVNVSYNSLRIVDRLTPEQQATFQRLVLVYNAITYPICILLLAGLVLPLRRVRLGLSGPQPPSFETVGAARRAALQLPLWCAVLSCIGWLPGGLLFPFGIERLSGPIDADVYRHFLISFTISGVIALTFSAFAVQFVALRVLYPWLWTDASDLRSTARSELAGQDRRLAWFQLLSVLIPLAAAVLMVGVGPEEFKEGYRPFRLLVTALIALGMAGLGVAMTVSRRLHEMLAALRGGERQ